jgi:hypothetical protein
MSTLPWESYISKSTNGVYSGYYVEFLNMIADELNYTVKIKDPPDKQYGSLLQNGEWTGIAGQLVNRQVDVGAVLSRTYERDNYITHLNTPVRVGYECIMYHKPEPLAMSIEILLKPFSQTVWLAFGGALITTTLVFYGSVAHVSTKHNNRQEHTYNKSYILRYTLNQGSDWSPTLTSSRIIYSLYTFGWIILVSTYTAYLVSFLSVKKGVIPFRTLLELSENTEYKLGVLRGASLYDSIHSVNYSQTNPWYQLKLKLVQDTTRDPSVIHTDLEFHRKRLIDEKYAFIGSSETYQAMVANSCSVSMMAEKGPISFTNFALRKNSAYARDCDRVTNESKKENWTGN